MTLPATAAPSGYDIEAYGSNTDVSTSIPAGVCAVDWVVIGGQGGADSNENNVGGMGGEVRVTTAVTAGQTYLLQVGTDGGIGDFDFGGAGGRSGAQASGGDSAPSTGNGGFVGGAGGGGAGGGASAVRQGSLTTSPALIIGAGGGGASGFAAGGAAGATGSDGGSFSDGPGIFGGGGGATTTSPGTGGSNSTGVGTAGTAGAGQQGATSADGAGGGGGGAFGGGSGATEAPGYGAGGGGGANLAPAGTSFNGTTTSRTGSGAILGTYVDCPPAPPTTPDPQPVPPVTTPPPPSAPTAQAATKAGKVYTRAGTRNTEVTGTGTPGATITVREGTKSLGTTTVNAKGTWTLTVKALKAGAHHLSATQTIDGRTSAPGPAGNIRIEQLQVHIIKATDPTKATRPLVRGRGNPGATVTVRTTKGKVLGKTTVRDNGRWRFKSVKLARGTYKIRATQKIAGTTIRSTTVTFTAIKR